MWDEGKGGREEEDMERKTWTGWKKEEREGDDVSFGGSDFFNSKEGDMPMTEALVEVIDAKSA